MGIGPLRAVPRGLLLIAAAATLVRAAALWIGRPEFTGWFNHTSYTFVQVRGLLERGALPYPDLPMLFLLDAGLARLLSLLGSATDAAIVAASRFSMSLALSLIPLPLYYGLRALGGPGFPSRRQWTLVAISAFLPLGLVHLPEMLPKNALGLLLLALLLRSSQRLLQTPRGRDVAVCAALLLAIALTHFGTAAATFLYGVALVVADAIVRRSPRRLGATLLALGVASALAAAIVHRFDPARLERILTLARGALGRALPVELAMAGRPGEAVVAIALLAAAAGLLALAVRGWARRGRNLPAGARTFWLAQILFCALLVLPPLDAQVMGRLALFAPLPALVLLGHVERFGAASERVKSAGVAVVALLLGLLAVGELVGARVHTARHRETLADLRALERSGRVGPRDLVLARTGADHVCNWYLRARAGTIPSLTLEDFERYERIWILNPLDDAPGGAALRERSVVTEADRYFFMRRDIPPPAGVEPAFATATLALYPLDGPPAGWSFDAEGRWRAYARPDAPSARPSDAGP